MARSVFSQSWHNAAQLRPRLLAHVRIHPHHYRGQRWYVLQDSSSGRHHRLTPGAYALVAGMDGGRTIEELWQEACNRGDGELPTQDEVVELLMQLHANDLLYCDVTPDSAELFDRYRKRRSQRWKQWIIQPTALRFPLLDPDAFLARWCGRMAWLFTARGAMLWAAIVLPALLLAAQNWRELTLNLSDHVLSTGNLIVLALVFPLVKVIHELGHGFATKVWGGAVHEMGVMLLVFAPVPYVDASAASTFRDKRRRMIVGAAGMMAELLVAALALFVWCLVEPGVVRAVAFNVMLVAGLSTLVVNGNPLLRYDGYYILADFVEMPNLGQRSQRYLAYCCDRYLLGARELTSPETAAEGRWLAAYAVASWTYRVIVMVSIILFVAEKFFIFGVVLALAAAAGLILKPLWQALRHLTQSPSLARRRGLAIRVAAITVGVVLLLGAFLPLPTRTQAEGVVWLPDKALLRAQVAGTVKRWLVEPGSAVRADTPLLLMEDRQLLAELEVAQAKVAEAESRYSAQQFADPVQADQLRQQLDYERKAHARLLERSQDLVVAGEAGGILTVAKPQDMVGRHFKKGELLGYLMDRQQLVARVAVLQDNIDLVRTRLDAVDLRFADAIERSYRVAVIREIPSALNELPTAALTPAGGGQIPVDPNDSTGLKTLDRVFFVDLSLPPQAIPDAFGGRVYVRFDHIAEPLFGQAYRRARQLLLSRFHV